MSAIVDRRTMLDALREADAGHDCPPAVYQFDELLGRTIIKCVGCGETIWRE